MDYSHGIDWARVGQDPSETARAIATTADAGNQIADADDMRAFIALSKRLTGALRTNMAGLAKAALSGLLPTRHLGCDSEAQVAGGILAAGVLGVTASPVVPVRPTHFTTDPTFSASFLINQISMSTVQLVVGEDPIAASCFNSGIALPPTDAPIIASGSPANVNVTNRAGAPQRFNAFFSVLPLSVGTAAHCGV